MQWGVCVWAIAGILGFILAGCAALPSDEAVRVLRDLNAVDRPSELKRTTPVPRRREIAFDGGPRPWRGDLYQPANAPARAAMVVVPGLTAAGKDDRRLTAFAATLARARFEVLVPEPPGLRRLDFTARDAGVLAEAIAWLAARAPDRPLGLTAISFAVSPALQAVERTHARARPDFMLAIGGFYDIVAAIRFVTTGFYRDAPGARWRQRTPNAIGKWVLLSMNVARLPAPPDRVVLRTIAQRRLNDAAAPLDDLVPQLGPDGRAVYALITNTDRARVDERIAALPAGVRAELEALDLSRRDLGALRTCVIAVHGADDPFVPASQSAALVAALAPGFGELHELASLDHVNPREAGLFDRLRLGAIIDTVLAWRDGHRTTADGCAPK